MKLTGGKLKTNKRKYLFLTHYAIEIHYHRMSQMPKACAAPRSD